MNLIIMGPQGSGKGTQAKKLSLEYSIPHISTGDIFRDNIKGQTELGMKVKDFLDQGKLVPDELTIEIIKERLSRPDAEKGYILDGFPRNLSQAKALDTITDLDKAVLIDVSDDEAIRRISSRRTCEGCGAVYSTIIDDVDDKCQRCGGNLIIRDDDRPQTIRERLEIYHRNIDPILQHYRNKSILIEIDGERPINSIFEDILEKLS